MISVSTTLGVVWSPFQTNQARYSKQSTRKINGTSRDVSLRLRVQVLLPRACESVSRCARMDFSNAFACPL